MEASERRRLFHTFLFPAAFVFLLWMLKSVEVLSESNWYRAGVFPRDADGLLGIITAPLIHADFKHLFSNSIPLLVLGAGLFYYYHSIAYKVFFIIWADAGFLLWLIGRESYHIGASGIVYGLAAFLFLSGIIRKHKLLMAFSLFVAFLYGSMVWGIFPIEEYVSWEAHLSGLVIGTLLAVIFRHYGPQKVEHKWEDDDDQNPPFTDEDLGETKSEGPEIRYHLRP